MGGQALNFQCDACGRQIGWTTAIAGKTGRCKCGALVRVPHTEPPEEYDLKDELPSEIPLARASAGYNMPAPLAAAAAAQPVPLQYQSQRPKKTSTASAPPGSNPIEPLTDLHIPALVLALGYVTITAWLGIHTRLLTAMIILGVVTLAMAAKSGVLSLIAWYWANQSGGNFGNKLASVLKICSVIVVADASLFWTWSLMVYTGAITNRIYVGRTVVVLFLASLVVTAIIAQVLFGLRDEDANLFSRLIAGGNLLINLVVIFVLVLLVRSAVNAAARARVARAGAAQTPVNAPPAAPGTASIPAASPAGSVVVQTPFDRQIAARLSKHSVMEMDGRDWKTSMQFRPQDRPIGQLIDQMYNFGAPKVYVETVPSRGGRGAGILIVDVELPVSSADRDACFSAIDGFQQSRPSIVLPRLPTTGRYVEIQAAR